ncbi:MAG: MFS transporter [Caldilineaceae bacterium]|nr:MFS transporter [Caldilineaceae bacterium]
MGNVPASDALFRSPNLQIVFGVALIAVLRSDSISPAFPAMAQALGVSSQNIGLLITVFAMPSIFLTPLLGVLADRWGRKHVLVPSLLLFGVAGGACMFARSFELLLTLRLVQGIGAAALSMLNITLIADLYRGHDLTTAMGYNAGIRSTGSTIYPILGGLLASLAWYYPFALSLLALPVALLVLLRLQNPEPEGNLRFATYLRQMMASLKTAEITALFLAGCIVFIMMFGAYLTYFPFLLEGKFGTAALGIGLFLATRSTVNALIASQLGRLVQRWSVQSLLKSSFLLYAFVFALLPFARSLATIGILTIVLGMAEGFYWPSSQAILGALAPLEHRAGFVAANDMVLKIGQTIGPLVMGIAFVRFGLTGTFLLAALLGLSGFALLTAFVAPRRVAALS